MLAIALTAANNSENLASDQSEDAFPISPLNFFTADWKTSTSCLISSEFIYFLQSTSYFPAANICQTGTEKHPSVGLYCASLGYNQKTKLILYKDSKT